MQTGDIILFKTNDILGRLVSFFDGTVYTHVGIYYGEIEKREFIVDALAWWVDLRPLDMVTQSFDIYRVKNLNLSEQLIKRRIIFNVGKAYDYKGLIGILLQKIFKTKVFQSQNKLFCSEFAGFVLYPLLGKNISSITPKTIYELYLDNKLDKIKE